jgi:hypothetical protein
MSKLLDGERRFGRDFGGLIMPELTDTNAIGGNPETSPERCDTWRQ